MYRDEWTADIINAITVSRELQSLWLSELLLAIKNGRQLPNVSELDGMAQRMGVSLPTDADVATVRLGTYRFHRLAAQIPISTEKKPSHENQYDSMVYQCFRLILAPLIDAQVFCGLQRGYHELYVSFFARKLTADLLQEFVRMELDRKTLAGHLRAQIVAPDREMQELIDVLSASTEK
jgi:hypothetical protein